MDGQKNSRLRRPGTHLEVDANGRPVLVGIEEVEQMPDGPVSVVLPTVPPNEDDGDARDRPTS